MTDEEKALLQGFIDNVHEQFVGAVVQGRQLSKERVEAVADGRILSGEQAKDLGLLDSLGNLEDAIALAGKLGGIEGEPTVVYAKPPKYSIWDVLMDTQSLTHILDRMTLAASHTGYVYSPGKR
jgi:protease-4